MSLVQTIITTSPASSTGTIEVPPLGDVNAPTDAADTQSESTDYQGKKQGDGEHDALSENCSEEARNDKTNDYVAKIRAGLNAAVIGLNTLTAYKIAELQHKLAGDYATLSEEYRSYYNENYRPLEQELITEALNEPLYVRDKDSFFKGQMLISAKVPYIGKLEDALSCTGRYCTGQRQAIMNDFLTERATIESMTCGLATRHADSEEIVRNTLRWERRNNVLKIGRDIPTEAISYAQLASGIFGSIGSQAAAGAASASWFLGHKGSRVDTVYNGEFKEAVASRYEPTPTVVQEIEPYVPPPTTKPEEKKEEKKEVVVVEQPKAQPKKTPVKKKVTTKKPTVKRRG